MYNDFSEIPLPFDLKELMLKYNNSNGNEWYSEARRILREEKLSFLDYKIFLEIEEDLKKFSKLGNILTIRNGFRTIQDYYLEDKVRKCCVKHFGDSWEQTYNEEVENITGVAYFNNFCRWYPKGFGRKLLSERALDLVNDFDEALNSLNYGISNNRFDKIKKPNIRVHTDMWFFPIWIRLLQKGYDIKILRG